MERTRRGPSSIDVAKRAGVSQSAVSRAFSGASVSEETRRRIMSAADELGYRPNALVRVISQQSNLIGVVMGEITNPFYPEVLEMLLLELESQGFRVLLKHLDGAQSADAAIEEVLAYRVRGVIVTSSFVSAAMAEHCAASDVPVVLFNRHIRDVKISSISCDNVDAGRMVANLFLDSGHKRPAFISGNAVATSNLDRKKGFLDRISERGGGTVPVLGNEHSYAVGAASMRELLALPERPDAVFCASDVIAFGALDALREAGIPVPREISIVGFDDIPMAAWAAFDLTTIRQPRRRMVREAVATLVARINGAPLGSISLVPGELVMRGTLRKA
ncbi:LacI family DNA-binding transcriptional regulator [Mesorhizobium sp. M0862]|uniref:LacI family DNA-binding transcriptional regulator n=1 Tax=Mesorhizobium sp. M0862 TaxID=2957015 RepID=UPI0033376541